MKRLIYVLLATATTFMTASCDDDNNTVVTEQQLPEEARSFVTQHFPDQSIDRIIKDDDRNVDYDVWLDNRIKIEFNSAGEWKEIDGRTVALPATLLNVLPDNVSNYLNQNYANQLIVQIERSNTYEIELSNGIELLFDINGNFIRVDN